MRLPGLALAVACGITLNFHFKDSAIAEAEESGGTSRIGAFFNHCILLVGQKTGLSMALFPYTRKAYHGFHEANRHAGFALNETESSALAT